MYNTLYSNDSQHKYRVSFPILNIKRQQMVTTGYSKWYVEARDVSEGKRWTVQLKRLQKGIRSLTKLTGQMEVYLINLL